MDSLNLYCVESNNNRTSTNRQANQTDPKQRRSSHVRHLVGHRLFELECGRFEYAHHIIRQIFFRHSPTDISRKAHNKTRLPNDLLRLDFVANHLDSGHVSTLHHSLIYTTPQMHAV